MNCDYECECDSKRGEPLPRAARLMRGHYQLVRAFVAQHQATVPSLRDLANILGVLSGFQPDMWPLVHPGLHHNPDPDPHLHWMTQDGYPSKVYIQWFRVIDAYYANNTLPLNVTTIDIADIKSRIMVHVTA